jgi:hypothetical protein
MDRRLCELIKYVMVLHIHSSLKIDSKKLSRERERERGREGKGDVYLTSVKS